MDGNSGKPENTGSYIWLRYATQFSVGERTHTIEMGIPVPIGASEALREQLLREAEAGIEQLANHVENRVAQITQAVQLPSASARSQSVAGTPGISGTSASHNQPSPSVAPSPKPVVPAVPQPQATPTPTSTATVQPLQPQRTPATLPSTASQPPTATAPTTSTTPTTTTPSREAIQSAVPSAKEVEVPATRHHIGVSMPSAPGMSGDAGGSMKLPQFIQYIKEAMGLTPKQAMDLLNVKTLSGLNLRDALEQLQTLVVRDVAATPTIQTPVVRETNTAKPEPKTPPVHATPAPPPSHRPAAPSIPTPSGVKEITNAVVRDMPPSYAAFDEEIDIDGVEDELDLGGDEGIEFLPELTDQEREVATDIFNRLKEVRGTSTASDARLRALHNVVSGQVSDEQLLQITDGVWSINAIKKLKSDQVESLISWAKQDEFINEAEIVIMLIQEGQYARSDR